MNRRVRRNTARSAGLALLVVALLLLVGSGSARADGPGGTLAAKGWWSKAQDSGLPAPLPAPPNVKPGQLNVQGNPTDPKGTAFSALRFSIGTNATVKALTIKVADDSAGAEAVLLACLTGSVWTGVENGTWQSAPNVDTKSCVNGQKAADGKSWTFPVGPLQLGNVLDIAIVPGPDANTKAPAAFALVLDAPGDGALETASGPPPTVSTISNNFTAPKTENAGTGATTGADTTFHAAPVAPIATGLPAEKVGDTATAPAKQAAAPVNVATSEPAKDRNKTPGYIVLALAAAIGLYAWRQDNLMAMNGGSLPGAPDEAGGLGRFSRPRHGQPPALT